MGWELRESLGKGREAEVKDRRGRKEVTHEEGEGLKERIGAD